MPPEISFIIGKRLFIHRVKQGPWLFGKVCSRWRAISRSSPNLWSSLNLCTQDDPVIKDIARIVRRLEAFLHYSQQVPLHVWMSTFLSPEFTRAIEPYKSRLFSLELQGGSIDDLTKECCLKTVDFSQPGSSWAIYSTGNGYPKDVLGPFEMRAQAHSFDVIVLSKSSSTLSQIPHLPILSNNALGDSPALGCGPHSATLYATNLV